MVASLIAIVAMGSSGILEDNYLDGRYDLGSNELTVKNSAGMDVQVPAQVYVAVKMISVEVESSGEERKARTTTERPGQIASPFSLSYFPDADNGSGMRDGAILNGYLKGRELGAEADFGKWLSDRMGRELMQGESLPRSITINPDANIKDGGWTSRDWGHVSGGLVREIHFVSNYELDGMPNQTIDVVSVPVMKGWIPVNRVLDERFTPDGDDQKDIRDSLGGVSITPPMKMTSTLLTLPVFPDPKKDRFSTTTRLRVDPQLYYGDVFKENGLERFTRLGFDSRFTAKDLVGLLDEGAPIGTGLNSMVFPELEYEGDPCGMSFTAPPGTMWVPDLPGYQVMTTGSRYNLDRGFADLRAGISLQGRDPNTMMTMCLNMDLKEPDGKVRYYPYRPHDGAMKALAEITDRTRFKGPWDQARMWAYTDRVTLEELNKRLLPPVSVRQYTDGLMDIARVGGISPEDMVKEKMLLAESVGAKRSRPELTQWAFSVLSQYGKKQLADYLKSAPEELVEKAGGDEEAVASLAGVLESALRSRDKEILKGAVAVVGKISDRSKLKGKVGGMRGILYSGDKELEKAGLEMLSDLVDSMPKDALEHLAANGKSDEVKDMAKGMLGG